MTSSRRDWWRQAGRCNQRFQLDDPRHGFLLRASAENVLTSFHAMRVDAASFGVAGDTTGLPALAPNDQLRLDIGEICSTATISQAVLSYLENRSVT